MSDYAAYSGCRAGNSATASRNLTRDSILTFAEHIEHWKIIDRLHRGRKSPEQAAYNNAIAGRIFFGQFGA
jgi:hypothetical protein